MPSFIPKIWRSKNVFKNIAKEYQTALISLTMTGASDYIIQATTQSDDESWETVTEDAVHTFETKGDLIRVQVVGITNFVLTDISVTATAVSI